MEDFHVGESLVVCFLQQSMSVSMTGNKQLFQSFYSQLFVYSDLVLKKDPNPEKNCDI